MSAIRVCRERDCITNLSRFNPGKFCWEHTADLTQTDRPTAHVRPRTNVTTKGIMSQDFVAGLPGTYEITAAERRHWARGGW